MATYRNLSTLTGYFVQNAVPSGTMFEDMLFSLKRKYFHGVLAVAADTTYSLGLFPSKACTITKVSAASWDGTGSADYIFKYGATGSSSFTSINTVAQTVSVNSTLAITDFTLNNSTPGASASIVVTTSNKVSTPNLYYCIEYYETA